MSQSLYPCLFTESERIEALEQCLLGILEQAAAQKRAGDKVCTLGMTNLAIIKKTLEMSGILVRD